MGGDGRGWEGMGGDEVETHSTGSRGRLRAGAIPLMIDVGCTPT